MIATTHLPNVLTQRHHLTQAEGIPSGCTVEQVREGACQLFKEWQSHFARGNFSARLLSEEHGDLRETLVLNLDRLLSAYPSLRVRLEASLKSSLLNLANLNPWEASVKLVEYAATPKGRQYIEQQRSHFPDFRRGWDSLVELSRALAELELPGGGQRLGNP
jgi:hypothetical protein